MKAFLLNFSSVLEQSYVHSVLNNTNSIDNWLSALPYSAILVSRLTCSELAAVLHSHFGDNLFIVIEANANNTSGWLPKEFWDFINNPQTNWAKIFALPRPALEHPPAR